LLALIAITLNAVLCSSGTYNTCSHLYSAITTLMLDCRGCQFQSAESAKGDRQQTTRQ